jgi:hypothetical protein
VADVAIETESDKRFGGSVNAGSVAAGTTVREPIFVPAKLLQIEPLLDHGFGTQHRLSIEERKLSIAVFFQKANAMPAAEEILDLVC